MSVCLSAFCVFLPKGLTNSRTNVANLYKESLYKFLEGFLESLHIKGGVHTNNLFLKKDEFSKRFFYLGFLRGVSSCMEAICVVTVETVV